MTDSASQTLLGVTQAMAIIDAAKVEPRLERIPLMDSPGRRLAQVVIADDDYPPFPKSMMDGYAVRCADVQNPPVTLRVIGEIAAGVVPNRPIEEGETVAIMTGAPLPPGADGVVPVEESERVLEETVRVLKAPTPARFIASPGSDVRAGEIVLKPGVIIGAPQIAVLASVGAAQIEVFAKPRVGVLTTGDELVSFDQKPGPSQIRNSNNPMLVSLLGTYGVDVLNLGTVPDQPEQMRTAISHGLQTDALFITGSMSMGTHDHVPRLLEELNVELQISKIKIKPGKPFVFGSFQRPSGGLCYVFGLPGNPVSGFICMVRLASRLLTRLGGGTISERWVSGRVDAGLPANGPREFYQPVVCNVAAGRRSAQSEFATITPLHWKGSADIYTLAMANALLVRVENEPPVPKGTLVRVLEI